eukprot:5116100-Prymnesium_polylepis.1
MSRFQRLRNSRLRSARAGLEIIPHARLRRVVPAATSSRPGCSLGAAHRRHAPAHPTVAAPPAPA